MAAHLRAGDDLGASGLSGDTDFTSSNLSSYSAGPPALVAKPQQQRGDGAGYDGGPHISYGDAEHGDDLDRQSRSSANSAFLASQRFQAGKLGAEEELDEFGAMLADTTGSRANLALSRLHLAAGTGDIAMVQSLLAEAAEAQDLQLLEDEDSLGRTPLIYGILANHLEVCEQLLSAGSDPNQRDADGRNGTPRTPRTPRTSPGHRRHTCRTTGPRSNCAAGLAACSAAGAASRDGVYQWGAHLARARDRVTTGLFF